MTSPHDLVIGTMAPLPFGRRIVMRLATIGMKLRIPGAASLFFWAILPPGVEFEVRSLTVPDDSPLARFVP